MKLRPRRATAPSPATAAADDPTGTPREARPPAAVGPRAVFARVLDGESLWVAVEGAPAGSSLAVALDGTTVPLVDDTGAGPSPYLAVRARLTDLDLPAGVHDLLLGSEEAGWSPLVAGSLPDPAPTRAPASPDGRWQYDVAPAGDGRLRLNVAAVEPGAPLAGLDADGAAVVLRLTGDQAADVDVLLVTDDGAEPVLRLSGGPAYRFSPEPLADRATTNPGTELRVVVDSPGGRLPVLRRDNDLLQPNRAVVLPEVGGAVPVARFRFDRQGRLLLRILDGAAGDDA